MTGPADRRAPAVPPESPAGVAERILDEVADQLGSDLRLAVLAGATDDPAVVLALVGSEQAPWPDPRETDLALGGVWRGGPGEIGTWASAEGSRSLLAVPVEDARGHRSAVVVADREASHPFDVAELSTVAEVVAHEGEALTRALDLAGVGDLAAAFERRRLAQDLHDGLAQELVALGYRIDFARRQASRGDAGVEGALAEVRGELSRILADLRLKMADLHVVVDPEAGLPGALYPRLDQFAEITGLAVRADVRETGLGLPAGVQDLVFRFVLELLADVRHARGASAVDLLVHVAAPQVRLRFAHDGESSLPSRDFSDHPLARLGAVIFIGHASSTGVELTLELSPADAGAADRHQAERIQLRS